MDIETVIWINHIMPRNMKKEVHGVPFQQRNRVAIKPERLGDSELSVKTSEIAKDLWNNEQELWKSKTC